jgi:hypothetical protein
LLTIVSPDMVALAARSRRLFCTLGLAGTFAFVSLGARAADNSLTLVLAGRTDRVVAAGRGVGVLREGAVSLLDGDGHVVARCAGASATSGRRARPDHTALSSEEVLGEAGFSDEDVSPEAEELLDEEGLDAPPRRRPARSSAGAPRALDLAGAPDAVWIGTVEGIWRLDESGCARAGLGGHAVELVAATGATVVAISGVTVWRRDGAEAPFAVVDVLTSRPHALALAQDGTAFVADEDGVVALDDGLRSVLTTPADALASCGPDVVALADAGVVRLPTDADAVLLGPRPPARALACVCPEGPRLLAAGVGVWSNATADAPWVEEAAGLGRSFASVASVAGRVWLAADDGLFATSFEGEPVGAPRAPRRWSGERPPPPTWVALLPRVALAGSGWTESNGVAGWRLWLLMTFSLDRFEVRRVARRLEDFR